MLLLSDLVHRQILSSDGRNVGQLTDLAVAAGGADAPAVTRILVKGSLARTVSLPWRRIESIERTHVRLRPGVPESEMHAATDEIEADEVLLVRDVLDTQIIDVVGQRLVRVADVVLARCHAGHLELVGVEVGFGAVLRRLGLIRIARRMRPDVVAWSDLHMISRRGHAIQLATRRSAVHRLDARSLAKLISKLGTEAATDILAVRGPAVAGEVVRGSRPEIAERMLRAMSGATADKVVGTMPPHHAADWRARLAATPPLRGRHLLRSRVWSRRRHPPRDHSP